MLDRLRPKVTAILATFAQNSEESVTHVYSWTRLLPHISEVWYKGETLKITGEGFLTGGTSGSSYRHIKLNKAPSSRDGGICLKSADGAKPSPSPFSAGAT